MFFSVVTIQGVYADNVTMLMTE